MSELYLLVFLAGLTGGLGHCIMMCGPVVLSYSVAANCRGLSPHLSYNLGRVTTYAVLGAGAGFAGSLVVASEAAHFLPRWFQSAAMETAGVLIVLMGLGMAGRVPFMKRIEEKAAHMPIVARLLEYMREAPSAGAFYPMGLLLGLIPCGLVYSALVASARAAMEVGGEASGIVRGVTMMLFFGVGTAIPLLALGRLSGFLGARMRSRFYRVSAVIVISMGVIFLYRGVSMRGPM